MKKILILCLALMLSGCWKTIPAFPEAPTAALITCPVLEKTQDNNFEDFLKIVVKNYESYYLCKNKTDIWIDWYNKTSKNYKEATK